MNTNHRKKDDTRLFFGIGGWAEIGDFGRDDAGVFAWGDEGVSLIFWVPFLVEGSNPSLLLHLSMEMEAVYSIRGVVCSQKDLNKEILVWNSRW